MAGFLEQLKQKQQVRRGPSDLLALDLATTGTKLVRIRRGKDNLALVGMDILPPLPLKELTPDQQKHLLKDIVPNSLLANYAALTVTSETTVVRLLSLPGHTEQSQLDESHVRENLGLEGEYRLGWVITSPPRGKSETKLLVAAMPESEALALLSLAPLGAPAPVSLEIAGISVLNSFMRGPGAQNAQESFGILDSGAKTSFLALFSKGNLSLIRKFEFGGDAVTNKVQQQLGVNKEIAQGIISDGSIDISQSVHEVMDPFLRQISISKDFVERREDCRLNRIFLSGGMSLSRYWVAELSKATGMEVQSWDPLEGLTILPNAIPDAMQGQKTRFTAAVGAALGALEPT